MPVVVTTGMLLSSEKNRLDILTGIERRALELRQPLLESIGHKDGGVLRIRMSSKPLESPPLSHSPSDGLGRDLVRGYVGQTYVGNVLLGRILDSSQSSLDLPIRTTNIVELRV